MLSYHPVAIAVADQVLSIRHVDSYSHASRWPILPLRDLGSSLQFGLQNESESVYIHGGYIKPANYHPDCPKAIAACVTGCLVDLSGMQKTRLSILTINGRKRDHWNKNKENIPIIYKKRRATQDPIQRQWKKMEEFSVRHSNIIRL
jgi:hypothetical protein